MHCVFELCVKSFNIGNHILQLTETKPLRENHFDQHVYTKKSDLMVFHTKILDVVAWFNTIVYDINACTINQ